MILPKISGPEVPPRLKKEAATADIPVVVIGSLKEKKRRKVVEAGAEDYVEKNSLIPLPGVNVLPKTLENVICRINRRRGIAFSAFQSTNRPEGRDRLRVKSSLVAAVF